MDKERECVELGECRPRHQSSKSTRVWCGGKEGLAHEWTWVDSRQLWNAFMFNRNRPDHRMIIQERKVCDRCGKQPWETRLRCRSHGVIGAPDFCDHLPKRSWRRR